ncbi:hypothetical protein [Actinophytocola xanthii]|uniref:DUF5709 domain-containing protein n=1 Tax=Actinophytocola xanthii TaxID=1912961 RepID=A0A1Q8CS55_9PSEU|nr:hypothetical protein [Actinophytocola xanthii]OLF17199.1 hypothetical protein BU204_12440 [Actinophytocola xanthii]
MSTDDFQSYAAPQDTGTPDAVESDPAALNSAEDLDEDRLRVDPLEAGMDPPERWSGADKYGMTPYEQAHARPLEDRLAEEEPDVTEGNAPGGSGGNPTDAEVLTEAEGRGQASDEAGGSMAATQRTPGVAG